MAVRFECGACDSNTVVWTWIPDHDLIVNEIGAVDATLELTRFG